MKKILLLLIAIIIPCCSYAQEWENNNYIQPEVTIEKGYKPEVKNSQISVDKNIFRIEPVQQKPIPKTIREHKIDYDNNGRPDAMPYALKDILIEY